MLLYRVLPAQPGFTQSPEYGLNVIPLCVTSAGDYQDLCYQRWYENICARAEMLKPTAPYSPSQNPFLSCKQILIHVLYARCGYQSTIVNGEEPHNARRK